MFVGGSRKMTDGKNKIKVQKKNQKRGRRKIHQNGKNVLTSHLFGVTNSMYAGGKLDLDSAVGEWQ